jgi:hypothetical protein
VDVEGDQDSLYCVFGAMPVTAQEVRGTTQSGSAGGDILAVLRFISHNRKTEPPPLAVVTVAPPCEMRSADAWSRLFHHPPR